MTRRTVIAAAAGAVAIMTGASAQAAEWWLVATSTTGATFVDRASVGEVEAAGRTFLKAWQASYPKETLPSGTKNSKNLYYFDCRGHALALKSYVDYKPSGEVRTTDGFNDYSLEWNAAVPDSVGEAELLFVCNASQGAGETTKFTIDGNPFFYVSDPDAAAEKLLAE